MKLNGKNIFLLDALGGVVSAVTNGIFLPLCHEWIGLSAENLRLLGFLASLFAVFSLSCYWFIRGPKKSMLLGIILANSSYCFLALAIAALSPDLTTLGRAYFVGEVLVIAGIVCLETKVYRRA